MLQLCNLNKAKVKGLKLYKDYCIESTLSTGDKILSFLYPSRLAKEVMEECYIRTKKDEFVIKETADRGDWKSVKAILNVEDLEGQVFEHFNTTEQTIEQCLTLAVAGTGWTVQVNGVTKRRTIRKTNCSTWDIIQQAKKTYLVEIEFDTINKIVKVADKLGSDKGVYFMDSLNLRSLDIQSNSYEFYTRLIAIGKNDLKVTVENFQYSSKKKTLIWKDERYTDINALTEDATAKLAEISKPYRSYGADIIDLANMSDKYSILSYGLGDIITLISKEKGIKEKQRIVKITEYPEEPERNNCEIANTILTFADIQKEYQDTTETVRNITSDNGTISEGAIKVAVEQITINKADIQDLNVVSSRIGTLEVTTATITQLNVANARIDNLIATTATITQLNATNAKITILEGKTANIETILAKDIFVELATVGKIVAGSSIIAESAIGNAQISSVSAVKIDTGILNTGLVTIQGANGRLKITGNRLQVFAGTTTLYERVSVGDVNGDGSIYGIRVRGADGVTILLDETGVKREGITDGSINNAKIGADANISGTKLDIASVVTSINGGTTTIQGSKIFVDGKTLDLSFSTLKSTVTSQGETISSHTSSITAMDSAIKLKVDTQTYNTKMTSLDGSISTINSNLSKATSDISVMQGQIALKVSQTDIDTSISKIQIGGRNLLLGTNIPSNKSGSGWIVWVLSDLMTSGDYIIKFKYTCSESNPIGISLGTGQGHDGTYEKLATLPIGTNIYWESTVTFERTSQTHLTFYTNKSITISEMKLEKGNKATGWTQAPEDTNLAIATVDTKVTTATSEINILKNQITLKVESTTFNNTVSTINTNVTTAETNAKSYADVKKTEAIGAAATDATTKANNAKTGAVTDSKTYTDGQITTVNSTLNSKVAEIKATTDSITSRVGTTESSITTINGNITSLQSRVSSAEQKITESAIISTVSGTITTKIDEIKVGTRNLIIEKNGFTAHTPYNSVPTIINHVITTTRTSSTYFTLGNNLLKPSGICTLSGTLLVNGNPVTNAMFLTKTANTYGATPLKFYVNDATGRFEITQNFPGNDFIFHTQIGPVVSGSIITIKDLKLESGNKATGWSIAPEDTEQAISSVDTKVNTTNTNLNNLTTRVSTAESSITQLNSSINLKVSQTDFNSLTGRVTSAESTISLHTTQIALKVDANGVKSIMEQNPNSIKVGFNAITPNLNLSNSGTFDIINGALTVKNNNAEVVIDGRYNIHKIIVTGIYEFDMPAGTQVRVLDFAKHNLGYTPVIKTLLYVPNNAGYTVELPYTELVNQSSDFMGVSKFVFVGASATDLRVTCKRSVAASNVAETLRIRYFIYKEVAF